MPGCHALNWTWSLNMPRKRPSRRPQASHESGSSPRGRALVHSPWRNGSEARLMRWWPRCDAHFPAVPNPNLVGAYLVDAALPDIRRGGATRRRRARPMMPIRRCARECEREALNSPDLKWLITVLPKNKKKKEKITSSAPLYLLSRCFIC